MPLSRCFHKYTNTSPSFFSPIFSPPSFVLDSSRLHTITPDRVYINSLQASNEAASKQANTHADILAIAAHPDDVELACGGVIAQASAEGKRVAIVECTRGEMGSRGTPEIRRNEAIEAAQILGLSERWNLEIPDGGVSDTPENVLKIIAALRHFTPNILLFPAGFDRHLDHEDAHRLVRRAVFQSGLSKIRTEVFGNEQQPARPKRLYCYVQTYETEPHFIVDIGGEHFATKQRSIFAHASQVHVPDATAYAHEPQTFISSPAFMQLIESRARHLGGRIGAEFGEGFMSVEMLRFASLSALAE
jgi:N-acetylglucosamine malate deacetylase 1